MQYFSSNQIIYQHKTLLLLRIPLMPIPSTTRFRNHSSRFHTANLRMLREWNNSISARETSSGENRSSAKKQRICGETGGKTGHHVRLHLPFVFRHFLTTGCTVFPLLFHSIVDEIPEASRPLITRMYQLWLVLAATLIINMVACIFVLTGGSSDGGKDLGASIG